MATTLASFAQLMSAVGITAPPASWRAAWAGAQASYPAEQPWLDPAFLDEVNALCGYAEDITAVLRETQAAIRADEELRRLLWLWHVVVFASAEIPPGLFGWPNPAAMGALAPMFPALVLLSGYRAYAAAHAARGIPAAVTRATSYDLEIWMRHHRRHVGTWGFDRLVWMVLHFRGKLYRLGRLQYWCKGLPRAVHVYGRRGSGDVLALSAAGLRYRRDGLADGTNGVCDPEAWEATFSQDVAGVTGYPITPAGYAQMRPVTLPWAEWESLLQPEEMTLDLHIPADGKMDHDACGASIREALAFFPRHFPEMPPPRALTCDSWLLTSQFREILPPGANIVRFLSEFYLYPVKSDEHGAFYRVFGETPADLTAAPRDSTLRRAILDYTLAGHHLHGAAGFILLRDLAWGSARYQG